MVAGSTTKSSEDEFIKCVSCGSEISQFSGNCPQCGSKLNDQVKTTAKSTRDVAKGFVLEKIRNGTVRNPSGPSAASSFSANPFSLSCSKAKVSENDTRDLRKLPTFSTGAFEQTLRAERRLDSQLKRAADSAAKAVFAHVERVEIEAMSQRQREIEGGSSSSHSFPAPPGQEDDNAPHEEVNNPVIAESALMFVATVAKIQLTASLTWLQQLTDLRRKCLACEAEHSDAQSPHWQCSEEVQGMLHDCRREFFRELGECREAHRECTKSQEGDDWDDFPDVRTLDRIMKQQAVMIWDPARDNADHRSAGVSCGPLPPWWSLTLSERIFHSLRSADLPNPGKGVNCHRDTMISDESDCGDLSTESDYGDLAAELNTALTRVNAQHSRALVAEHSLFWSENSREVQKKMILDKKLEAELLEEKYKTATEESTKLHFKMLDLKKQVKQKEDELFQKETALKKALGATSRGPLVCKLCGVNLEAADELPELSGAPERADLLTVPNARSKTPVRKKKKSGGGGGGGFGGGGGGGNGGAGGNADQEPFVTDEDPENFTDEQPLEQQQCEPADSLHIEAPIGLESKNAGQNSQNETVQKGQNSIAIRQSAVSSMISFPPNITDLTQHTWENASPVIENFHSLKEHPPRRRGVNEISQGCEDRGLEVTALEDDKHFCETPQIAPVGRLPSMENRSENFIPIGSRGSLSRPVVDDFIDSDLRIGIADVWKPASPKSPGNQSTGSWQSEASAVVAQLSELRVRVRLNQKRAVATGSATLPLAKCQAEDGQHERGTTFDAFDAKYTYEYEEGCKPWQRLYEDARRRVDYLERSAALISARDQEQAASILAVAHEHLQDLKGLGLCSQSSSSHLLFEEPENKISEKKRMSGTALSASAKESVLPNLMVPRPSSAIRASKCLQTASMARRRRPPSAAGSRPASAALSRMQQQKEELQGRAENVFAIKNKTGVSIGRAASTGSILPQKKSQSGRTTVAPFAFDTSLPKTEQRPQKRCRPKSGITKSNSSNSLNFLAQHVARVCGPRATKTTDVDTEPWDFSDLAVRGMEMGNFDVAFVQ